jgi:hypothetical protein
MNYKLHPLLKAALNKNEYPLVLDAAVTKVACEHDILLDEILMAQSEVMTSQDRFLELSVHRRFCKEVLAAAIDAITENERLEISGRAMVKLVAMLMVQDNKVVCY